MVARGAHVMNLYNVVPMVEDWQDLEHPRIYVRADNEQEARSYAAEEYGLEISAHGFFIELLEGEPTL
jgi:hypothetical protein